MCIIAIKSKGIKFPSVETVQTMCENNPHGFSIVTQRGSRRPRIYKTLKIADFMSYYRALLGASNGEDTSMFIHTRIKTHGTMRIENCHGWRTDGLVFAHNGILSIQNREDMTDSETFLRDIFAPIYRIGGWKAADKAIQACIGTSKFVFMDKQGELRYYGHYIEDDGVLYSNTSYQPVKTYQSWWQKDTRNAYYPKTRCTKDEWNYDFLGEDVCF